MRLPIGPDVEVAGLRVDKCSYFGSKTLPLRLVFDNADPAGDMINILFKVGDEMRRDMLTMQVVRLMNKLWLHAGLDMQVGRGWSRRSAVRKPSAERVRRCRADGHVPLSADEP